MAAIPTSTYPAIKHSVIGLLQQLTPEQKEALAAKAKTLLAAARTLKGTTATQVESAQNSTINNPYVKASPSAAGVLAFATLMRNTIDGWDEATQGTRAYNVVSLFAMVATAVMALLIYLKTSQQAELTDTRKQQLEQISAIKGTLKFLRRTEKFVRNLTTPPLEGLDEKFNQFNQYLLTTKCGTAPNPLVSKLAEAHLQINDLHALTHTINTFILPMIKQHVSDLEEKLEELGFTPPVQEEAAVDLD